MKIYDVPGYEGSYSITRCGKVYSHYRNKYCKLSTDKYGYFYISLSKESVKKKKKLHRLLALTFIPNPNKLPCINHINGIKKDNRLENLEWCSYSRNNKHAFEIGARDHTGELSPVSKLKESDVLNIRRLYKSNKYTYAKLASIYNISAGAIGLIIRRKTWNHI